MGWTEQEYKSQRWDFIMGLMKEFKEQNKQINK